MSGGCLGFLPSTAPWDSGNFYVNLGCRYPRWAYLSLGLEVMDAPIDGVNT